MWERAELVDFASLAKLCSNEVMGTLHRALRLSCTSSSSGKLFGFDGQTASSGKLFPLQTHDCAPGHRSTQQSHQVKSSEHIFAARGGCVVGWLGRTVGCRAPRGEQMRMTCWNLVFVLHRPLQLPSFTTAPPNWPNTQQGCCKAISTSAFCHSSAQSPLEGPLCYLARAEQLWGCSVLFLLLVLLSTAEASSFQMFAGCVCAHFADA